MLTIALTSLRDIHKNVERLFSVIKVCYMYIFKMYAFLCFSELLTLVELG